MISVAILGASGRMGALTKELIDADANLKLHAALGSKSDPAQMLGADVVVDFTLPGVSESLVQFAVEHDMKILVGTSGWSELKLNVLRSSLAAHPKAGVLVVPNFSIGSMLLQRFAAEAAKHLDSVEIIESHHAGKVDSPSGTAIATAEKIAESRKGAALVPGVGQPARGEIYSGVPIHSLRQPGVSAKQDVIFAGTSEQLTLSHDVSSSRAYSLGILRSIEFIAENTGLHVGLDSVLR
jgi:4-hydroxy-tetrahydrodipicolinate reductase